jgi:DNA-binding winged helix-turn-helix (wHTH) protein/TolB-like protein/Flp pilus assembly protein TadD
MKTFYEFDSFRVDEEKRQFWQDGKMIPIKPKTFDTLLVLLKNRNEVISKDELVKEIWQGMAVTDDSLTKQISLLRKLLGGNSENHRYILTVPGVGYKFVADVSETSSNRCNPLFTSTAAETQNQFNNNEFEPAENSKKILRKTLQPSIRRLLVVGAIAVLVGLLTYFLWPNPSIEKTTALGVKKIAILPFRASNEDETTNALKQGMTDNLVTRLSKIEALTVLPSAVVNAYEKSGKTPAEFGRQINADAVLDGIIQKNTEQIRVFVQMIRVNDGRVIWSEIFQDTFTNVLEVQSLIAYKIAEALSLELSDDEKRAVMKRYTKSTEAYRLYLDARYFWINRSGGEGLILAKKNYEQAINLDPKFGLAYVGLANLLVNSPSRESYREMASLAWEALEIDESLGEAHEILGFALWRGEWNWAEAENHIQKAIKLSPKDEDAYLTLSMLQVGRGEFAKARQTLDNSLLVPTTRLKVYQAAVYFFARDYDAALTICHQILAENPRSVGALSYLVAIYPEKGMHQEAIATAQRYASLDKIIDVGALVYLSNAYIKAGQTEKGRAVLEQILQKNAPASAQLHGGLAMIYGNLGEKDKAFEHLAKSIENREWWAFTLKVAPYFDSLRDDARYSEMLKKVNLTE